MLVSLTVGKVDAGVAVLLTEDKRLIEFPSILLPPDIHSGSIVDIDVSRNQHAELIAEQKFAALQDDIYRTFGDASPGPPVLRCRNATQTSVVLEWDPIDLATAELRSLSLYRNGTKAGVIPRDKLSTKISGLALDTEYSFHLVLRTTAGHYASDRLTVRTHKMTDLTGITVTPGPMPPPLRDSLADTVRRVGAKLIDSVRIDTTHFVCTEPRGAAWEKAVELNVPVVVPDWLKGCEREGRVVGVRGYYLDADPKLRQMGASAIQQQRSGSVSNVPMRDSPRIEHTPPTPERSRAERAVGNGAPAPAPEQAPSAPTPAPTESAASEAEAHPSADGQSIAGTTMVEKHGEAAEEDEDDEDDEESDDTEKAIQQGKEEAERAASKNETTQGEAAQVAEEDGKFDEVAL